MASRFTAKKCRKPSCSVLALWTSTISESISRRIMTTAASAASWCHLPWASGATKSSRCDSYSNWAPICKKLETRSATLSFAEGGSLPGSRAMQKSREIASTFRDLVTKSATGLDRSIAWVIAMHSVKWKRMQTITLGGQTATTAPACEPIPISFQTASRPTSPRPI